MCRDSREHRTLAVDAGQLGGKMRPIVRRGGEDEGPSSEFIKALLSVYKAPYASAVRSQELHGGREEIPRMRWLEVQIMFIN